MIGVIPAAGKGVRFKELGKEYPKAILPYKNKPILVYNIENMLSVCEEVRVVVGHQKEKIVDIIFQYFENDPRIKTVDQKYQDGLSSAVLDGIEDVDKEQPLLIVLGDLLVESSFKKFSGVDYYSFVSVKNVPDYSRWCMVEPGEDDKVKKFFDKPKTDPATDLAVSGVYLFQSLFKTRSLIQEQKRINERINGEYQISFVMERIEDLYIERYLDIVDFGTLEEYLENKNSPVSRSFNRIAFNGDIVVKSSIQKEKILAEFLWFNNIPDEMKVFTPHVFYCNPYEDEASYTMEKLYSPTLRDVFLFLDYSLETWETIINDLFNFVLKEESFTTSSSDFFIQDFQKVERRAASFGIHPEAFLKAYKDFAEDHLDSNTVMHGDLCFSNITYDLQSKRMKVIDPKGPIFGSYKYDLAKLFHSILYPYDFIDSDLYFKKEDGTVGFYDSKREPIRKLFLDKFEQIFGKEMVYEIKLITASLFLSMLPIHSHSEEHQKLFIDIFKSISKELGID